MADETNPEPTAIQTPRYRWPWFVLGAVVLAIVLAVIWMSGEVRRAKRIRELNSPPAAPRSECHIRILYV
jgi:hypothetical protein